MMTHHLFIWTLALMLNAAMPSADGEPEDPYRWLEEVSGAKSLAWVKERNAESAKELTGSAEFQALDRRIRRDPGFGGSYPDRAEAGALLL